MRHPEDDSGALRFGDDTASCQTHRTNSRSPVVTHSREHHGEKIRSEVFRRTLEQTIHRWRIFVPVSAGDQLRHDSPVSALEFQVLATGGNQHCPGRQNLSTFGLDRAQRGQAIDAIRKSARKSCRHVLSDNE